MTGPRALALACAAAMILTVPCHAGAGEAAMPAARDDLAWLSLPLGREGPFPAVLILADRTGPDGREVPYADHLLAAGIAVIQLGSDRPEEAAPLVTPSGLHAMVHRLAPGRLDPSRLGLLGFGAGGRVALTASEVPVAALYPACDGLPPGRRSDPVLLLHPDNPREAAACRHVDPRAEAVTTATHGWDHGQGLWAGGTAMLPHPDGSRARLFARSDAWATQETVARVVRYFRAAFGIGEPQKPQRAAPATGDDREEEGQPQRPLSGKEAMGLAVREGR